MFTPSQHRNPTILLNNFGNCDQLVYQQNFPFPSPSTSQVLIENAFAGVNPIDYKTRQGLGWLAQHLAPQLPAILGLDFAGTVVQSIPNSTINIGDRVCGLNLNAGCYSRYLSIEPQFLAKIPEKVTLAQAAALPTAGLTAYQLIRQANLQAGEKVLLSAPAGGVGHLLLQLLKQQQVEVTVLCSAEKAEFALALGADHWLDYHHPETFPDLFVDLFIDLIGGNYGVTALKLVKNQGRVICVPTIHVPLLQQAGAERGLKVEQILVSPNSQDLTALLSLLAKGELKLHLSHIFPLSDVAKTHHLLESGRTIGKLVLQL
ncbi:quinone oxidoreductase [Mergibacter septicus]|uniref:Quinone oxidoreductase n=1 Tax=Mergibacter septicus TaxID=221402 RepID=A0A8E3S8Y2_9PAST|nr:NADP-dependent oxidoreductase [Mergibacter septicus]AWX15719.1 quinone oxidoreductase [Mergibacter septicus]QDJ14972.1 quinone oxidoreductase [Mergibacter septicus]UTU47603.1 NADP-dependent oxidoreductase [Mergibacter septicus]WMR96791.1 NADP-dependent oxidoreductase [Mergibacter septicus]